MVRVRSVVVFTHQLTGIVDIRNSEATDSGGKVDGSERAVYLSFESQFYHAIGVYVAANNLAGIVNPEGKRLLSLWCVNGCEDAILKDEAAGISGTAMVVTNHSSRIIDCLHVSSGGSRNVYSAICAGT